MKNRCPTFFSRRFCIRILIPTKVTSTAYCLGFAKPCWVFHRLSLKSSAESLQKKSVTRLSLQPSPYYRQNRLEPNHLLCLLLFNLIHRIMYAVLFTIAVSAMIKGLHCTTMAKDVDIFKAALYRLRSFLSTAMWRTLGAPSLWMYPSFWTEMRRCKNSRTSERYFPIAFQHSCPLYKDSLVEGDEEKGKYMLHALTGSKLQQLQLKNLVAWESLVPKGLKLCICRGHSKHANHLTTNGSHIQPMKSTASPTNSHLHFHHYLLVYLNLFKCINNVVFMAPLIFSNYRYSKSLINHFYQLLR